MEIIDWASMNSRNYHDRESRSVCMAECLSPRTVAVGDFFKVFVPDDEVANQVTIIQRELRVSVEVTVNGGMFN